MRFYKRVVCADGFSMSVQAHEGSYCSPRASDVEFYESVEIGFPSARDPLLKNYAENPDADIVGGEVQTVYGWVPAGVVRAVIRSHGGQVGGECPPLE